MSRSKLRLIALACVTAWCIFALAYVGREDGSSGLSVLGWLQAIFFFPGLCLMQAVAGAHSNADIPRMAAVGWVLFALCGMGIAEVIASVCRGAQQRAAPTGGPT